MKYYVDCNAKPCGDGSKEKPFNKIQMAAHVACFGDEILVYPGVYREEVNPVYAGKEKQSIIYRSIEPRKAIITGAEIIKEWEHYKGDVWKVVLPNKYFGNYNPYKTLVTGDWLSPNSICHTGEVFLNSKSLYEKDELTKIISPEFNDESWDIDFTKHTWYTCQDEEADSTVIYANFQGKNPNEECVEITVRPHCFYPEKEHVDYITLEGFVVTKAATNWAPPTALQEGMIGPHWSKGWVIDNCEVSHSKCSGISLGKYKQLNNDNKWSDYKYKDGTQTQRECLFIAKNEGWSKETIGSHIIRNCDIHDCGQAGIVGNLGCVFSIIENNNIHHINNKRNIVGAEVGAIKFHAAIDVIIQNNQFHDSTRGIWLDWQTQGTRVSRNLFFDNCMARDHLLKKKNKGALGLGEDLFIELGHGPTLVDNNIFLSERCVRLATQGVAFVHNLFYGSITAVGCGDKNGSEEYDSTRYSPIHLPHSTEIIDVMSILHGDVRFYNNVFVQPEVRKGLLDICSECDDIRWDDENLKAGTSVYNEFMNEKEWKACFSGYCGEGSSESRDKYYMPLPVYAKDNIYFNGAKPWVKEINPVVDTEHKIEVTLFVENGNYKINSNLMEYLTSGEMISSDTLGFAFEPEERFEEPTGDDIIFDTDFYGNERVNNPLLGPFA